MTDLDKILRHAREHGEALLYTPPAEGEPAGFELVAYRPRRAIELREHEFDATSLDPTVKRNYR